MIEEPIEDQEDKAKEPICKEPPNDTVSKFFSKPLTYVGDDGKKLYGYSQIDQAWTNKLLLILILILFCFLCLAIFVVWKTMHWHIIGKIITALGAC